jgi:prolyl-tRNA synthetase
MALPVLKGLKSEQEKFAGALRTYCIEALMLDGKALQAGTSHNLGQNFSKAFDVKFQNREGGMEYVWQTSWGASTRLIGALVLGHGDDEGLILPPALAPIQVVIVPIWKTEDEKVTVGKAVETIRASLNSVIRIHADLREEVCGSKLVPGIWPRVMPWSPHDWTGRRCRWPSESWKPRFPGS